MGDKKATTISTGWGLLIIVVAVWAIWHFASGGQDMSLPEPSKQAATQPATNSKADQEAKEFAWMERGKGAARSKLKDPDSAQFRNVVFHRGADGGERTHKAAKSTEITQICVFS